MKAILLVFANKQDMEGAMSPTDIAKELGLATLRYCFLYRKQFGLNWIQRAKMANIQNISNKGHRSRWSNGMASGGAQIETIKFWTFGSGSRLSSLYI